MIEWFFLFVKLGNYQCNNFIFDSTVHAHNLYVLVKSSIHVVHLLYMFEEERDRMDKQGLMRCDP